MFKSSQVRDVGGCIDLSNVESLSSSGLTGLDKRCSYLGLTICCGVRVNASHVIFTSTTSSFVPFKIFLIFNIIFGFQLIVLQSHNNSSIFVHPTAIMKSTISQRLGFAAILALGATSVVNACSVDNDITITFYGFPDNDPPGATTAYNCGGRNNIAGGVYSIIPYIST